LLATLVGGLVATTSEAQTPAAKAKASETELAKSESDDSFIRRISKDLRGTDPTPAEVHFFVNSKDASKRQKLIDLFIQERQAKQKSADADLNISSDSLLYAEDLKEIRAYMTRQREAKAKDKGGPDAKVDPLEARRLQLEADLKKLEAELRDLKKLQSDKKPNNATPIRMRTLIIPPDAANVRLRTVINLPDAASVIGMQKDFFRSLIDAAKDKKDATAITQTYLDSLTKYIKDHPKAADAPDAMLQVELVYRALGKPVEAKAWGDKLKREHPNSNAAKQRQSSLERLPIQFFLGTRGEGALDMADVELIFSAPLKVDPTPKSK
jgi:hypothetical protein